MNLSKNQIKGVVGGKSDPGINVLRGTAISLIIIVVIGFVMFGANYPIYSYANSVMADKPYVEIMRRTRINAHRIDIYWKDKDGRFYRTEADLGLPGMFDATIPRSAITVEIADYK